MAKRQTAIERKVAILDAQIELLTLARKILLDDDPPPTFQPRSRKRPTSAKPANEG